MKDNSRWPSHRKSTGHGTGVLMARTVSWPPQQARRVARIIKRRRNLAFLERLKALSGAPDRKAQRDARVQAVRARQEQERAGLREATFNNATPGLIGKLAAKVRGFLRKTV